MGSSTYAFELTQALSDLGHDVSVFRPSQTVQKLRQKTNGSRTEFSKIKKVSFPSFALSLFSNLRPQDFDIIHSQAGAGLFAKSLDIETTHHFPHQPDQIIQAVPSLINAKRSRFVITVSTKAQKEIASRMPLIKNKLRVIPNGVNKEFLTTTTKIRLSNENKIDEKSILYVNSDLSVRKNLPLALEFIHALSKTTLCRLKIVGPNWGRLIVLQEAQKYGMQELVTYYSGLSSPSLRKLYDESDALIVTSSQEGFGIPIIEAAATGLPFVSFDVGIAREMATSGFGSVASNKTDFLFHLVTTLKNGRFDAVRGKEYVANNYSWRKNAQATVNLYKEI